MPAPLMIGVLVPHSQIYPLLGQNLLAGMRVALEQLGQRAGGRKLQLVAEPCGLGQIEPEQKSIKLLNLDGAGLVLGLLNANVAVILQQLYLPRQVCCIALNLGEHIVRQGEHSPLFPHLTFGMWQANFALGQWAAQQIGRRVLVAQSFYDSGYDLPFAFRHGFTSAGGEVVHTFVTHRPPDRGDFTSVFAALREQQPDLVFGSYCGPAATAFVRAYADAGFAGQIPLLGSGMLCAEDVLAQQGDAAAGVITALASGDPQSPPARAFAAAFAEQTDRAPDLFATLGYEGMLLAAAALDAVDGQPGQVEAFCAALAQAQISGPRGTLTMHAPTHLITAPAITLRQVQRQPEGLALASIAQLPVISEIDPIMESIFANPRSGWLNPYLCV